jgi:hypothetical protein
LFGLPDCSSGFAGFARFIASLASPLRWLHLGWHSRILATPRDPVVPFASRDVSTGYS